MEQAAPNRAGSTHNGCAQYTLSGTTSHATAAQSSDDQETNDEQAHWEDVCRAYRQYAMFAVKQFGLDHPNRLANLPPEQQAVLPEHLRCGTDAYAQRLKLHKEAAIRNQFVLDCILRHAGQHHSQEMRNDTKFATEEQISKVSSVLKSLNRDWSTEAKAERDMCYLPIVQLIQKYLPNASNARICVPGAGLGRLACELAAKGYTVQGNDFSLYMLLASDFVLNAPLVSQQEKEKQPLAISPWLLETRNVVDATDPVRAIQIPDQDPFKMVAAGNNNGSTNGSINGSTNCGTNGNGAVPESTMEPSNDFSMAAGEFVSIYSAESEASAWDAVACCFFLDTSPVIVQYLQVIHHMLKPGGYLVNFGPLHWHWSGPPMPLCHESMQGRFGHLDQKYLHSVDFCWEDVRSILVNIGFLVMESREGIPALYTADERSMMRTEFKCIQFVAQKL